MKILLLLLLTGCSFLPIGTPAVESFKYQIFPQEEGYLIAYELIVNKHTKTVAIDAGLLQSGNVVFNECDRYTQDCSIKKYNFLEYHPKKNIRVVDGITTTLPGEVVIFITKNNKIVTKLIVPVQ
jgi:hypothetical protein